MAIDTIFLCFCEDTDRNDGVKKPYFMSRGLMVRLWRELKKSYLTTLRFLPPPPIFQKFVDNSNEALEAEERRRAEKKARKNYSVSRQSLVSG